MNWFSDLPGYANAVYCQNCMSTNHTVSTCTYFEEEDDNDRD